MALGAIAMALITPEIAEYLALRWKPWSSRTINEDLIAQIPPELLVQLEREGLSNALMSPLMMIGGFAGISVLMHLVGLHPLIDSIGDLTMYLVMFSILAAAEFRTLRRLPVHRELTYRYKHGKWRWER
jgi:hypothetical protein